MRKNKSRIYKTRRSRKSSRSLRSRERNARKSGNRRPKSNTSSQRSNTVSIHLQPTGETGRAVISERRDAEKGQSVDENYALNKVERKAFVAKVYGILTLQLTLSFLIIFGANLRETAREWMYDHSWIIFIFMAVTFVIYTILVCIPSIQRSFPLNFILLMVHACFFSVMAAFISARYSISVIWLAFLATAIITVVASLIARYSPWDITGCGIVFFIAFLALLIFSIVAVIISLFILIPIVYLIISGISVVLLSLYLIYMTQLILGDRKLQLDTEDVVFAVIVLYTDIIHIFLRMLYLINACEDQN